MDTVKYENLEVGKEYVMTGELHKTDTTGKDNGVVEGSKNSTRFTPTSKDGEVEVELKVDTSDLQGKKLVAFEKCVRADKNATVATHEDIKDEGQTVTVATKTPKAFDTSSNVSKSLAKTGDELAFELAVLLLIGSGAFVSAMYVRNRKNDKKGGE